MSKLGAHIVQGPRNGYAPHCNTKPAVVLSVEDGGALSEAHTNSGGHTWTIFRHYLYKDAPPGIDQTTPDGARAMANQWYPQLRARWQLNPADFYTTLNEPGGHDLRVIPNYVAYEMRMIELAKADGYKLCVLNLAWGTPDDGAVAGGAPNGGIETWKTYYVPVIRAAFEAGMIYGRHGYGQPSDASSWRPFQEAEYLRSAGLGYGGMVITEMGINAGDHFPGTEEFMRVMGIMDARMMQHTNMIGGAAWTLGDWNGAPNWQDAIPQMSAYNVAHPTPKWTPPVTPPQSLPKIVILKKPQKADMTLAENEAANLHAWENYGRTTTHSTDDMIRMLSGGNPDSYAILAYPDRASQAEAKAALTAGGYRWVEWPEPVTFRMTHWPTDYKAVTQRWGANPEVYKPFGLPGHDGVDIVAPTSSRIIAVATGVVSAIHTNPTSHNYGIHVRVNHVDSWQTIYAHLEGVSVVVGQTVTGGQQIGKADNTGNSKGSHLHIALKRLGYTYVDPVTGIAWPSNLHNPEPELMKLAPGAFPQPYDMSRYFFPASGSFGQLFILKNSWSGGDERCQLQRVGDVSYVTKNSQYEKRVIGSSNIQLVLDTSPGNGEYYTVSGVWLPRFMAVGESFARTEMIKFFRKGDCVQSKPTYTSSTSIRFDAQVASWTCPENTAIRLADVIQLSWLVNGVVDETYWYANGLGLVRWQKHSGQKSWINELIPVGSQQNNVREVGCFPA